MKDRKQICHVPAKMGAHCVGSPLKKRFGQMATDWWTKDRPQQNRESVDLSEPLTECGPSCSDARSITLW